MNQAPQRAVFDCMVFAQALISPDGPAGVCVEAARSGRLQLLLSDYVLRELNELPAKLPPKLKVTAARVDVLIAQLQACGESIDSVPSVYTNPFDPDDSPYVDLAVGGAASLIVSRDRHMLRLMDRSLPAGHDFLNRFPNLIVMTPEDILKKLRE
jgi:putative PIN family toxin of toxin-antitoxin system